MPLCVTFRILAIPSRVCKMTPLFCNNKFIDDPTNYCKSLISSINHCIFFTAEISVFLELSSCQMSLWRNYRVLVDSRSSSATRVLRGREHSALGIRADKERVSASGRTEWMRHALMRTQSYKPRRCGTVIQERSHS